MLASPHNPKEWQDSLNARLNTRRLSDQMEDNVYQPVHLLPMGETKCRIDILTFLEEHTDSKAKTERGRVHMGTGGLFNFTIAAQTKADAILLFDANPTQALLWDHLIGMLKQYETPKEFKEALGKLVEQGCFLKPDGKRHRLKAPADSKESEQFSAFLYDLTDIKRDPSYMVERMFGWLTDPDAYRHLRTLAQQGHIVHASFDLIHDRRRANLILEWLHERHLAVHTFNASNILEFLAPKQKQHAVINPNDDIDFDGGVIETALEMDKEKKKGPEGYFYASLPFYGPALSAARALDDIGKMMDNIKLFMQHDNSPVYAFITEANKDNNRLSILDREWARTYRSNQWNWTQLAERMHVEKAKDEKKGR